MSSKKRSIDNCIGFLWKHIPALLGLQLFYLLIWRFHYNKVFLDYLALKWWNLCYSPFYPSVSPERSVSQHGGLYTVKSLRSPLQNISYFLGKSRVSLIGFYRGVCSVREMSSLHIGRSWLSAQWLFVHQRQYSAII